MKIIKLGLLDFGKFSNKFLQFNEGLNIVYGENESGKSTTFAFIDAMLYGFSKDSTKKRLTDELYEKYKPWISKSYKGYMELENNNIIYRIERDFENDLIKFFNITSGDNISNDDRLYKYSKIAQPGAYIFDVNREVFRNTLYISQLKTKVNFSDSKILNSELKNFISTGDRKFNIVKAIELLDSSLKEIGKKTQKNSEIGKLNKDISHISYLISSIKEDTKEYKKLNSDVNELNFKLESIRKQLRHIEDIESQKKFLLINSKIKELEYLKSNKKTNCIEKFDYEEIYNLEKDYLNLVNKIEFIKGNIKKLEILDEDDNIKDANRFFELKEKLEDLNKINYSLEINILNENIKDNKKNEVKYLSATAIAVLSSIIILIVSIRYKLYPLMTLITMLLLYSFLRIKKFRVSNLVTKRLKMRIDDYGKLSNEKTIEKKSMDKYFENLEDKYDLKSFDELLTFFNKVLKKHENITIKNKVYIEENAKSNDTITYLENQKNILNSKIKNILEKYGFNSINELKREYTKFISKDAVEIKIQSLEEMIEHLLAGKNIEYYNRNIEIEDTNFKKEELVKEYNDLELIKIKFGEKLKSLEDSLFKLRELEEDKGIKLNKLKKLENKLENIELAKNTILKLENKNASYISTLIEIMEKNIYKITNGKYSRIMLNNEFNIAVYDEFSHSFVEVEKLSNGTIDQIYISFRLAVAKIIFGDPFIILDDQFIQYDDFRIKLAMEFLANEFSNSQIIIFTATKREEIIMNSINKEFSLIEMGNL